MFNEIKTNINIDNKHVRPRTEACVDFGSGSSQIFAAELGNTRQTFNPQNVIKGKAANKKNVQKI